MILTLAEYLDMPGNTATALAERVGCSVSTITRAASGETLPTRKIASKIYEHTNKMVQPGSYYSQATA